MHSDFDALNPARNWWARSPTKISAHNPVSCLRTSPTTWQSVEPPWVDPQDNSWIGLHVQLPVRCAVTATKTILRQHGLSIIRQVPRHAWQLAWWAELLRDWEHDVLPEWRDLKFLRTEVPLPYSSEHCGLNTGIGAGFVLQMAGQSQHAVCTVDLPS